ncbi:hypothetical protein DFR29_12630 [Tahibacter aquaticus]|uniref:Uncharacterized protein n=1 Tax=Tahibacter aquaticus TaxID=520092 RepID=A0A4R6YJ67_9GAMM|nr:methylamine utilization protein MauJ [Tahibacter aquaticus]TDR36994.1 hypothetical protein DFR29_12630 [Tahibacter aquaticus]
MNTTTLPSTIIPFEQLGPAGIRGELDVLAMVPNETRTDSQRLNDATRRSFKVTARLSKAPIPANDIKGDFNENDGTSYIYLPEGSRLGRVRCPDGVFEIQKNELGQQSLIEFSCEACSATEARALFHKTALPFLDHLAYVANCPMFVVGLRIDDPNNLRTTVDYISPHREVTLNAHAFSANPDLTPIYALYRDAKNSHSDFYTFLCYHKILDGLLGTRRIALREKARQRNAILSRLRDLVPADKYIADSFRAWIGMPIKKFFDEVMTPQFRNAVAHFILKDGSVLNLSDPNEIQRYSDILYISELCVREVIDNHAIWLAELKNAS